MKTVLLFIFLVVIAFANENSAFIRAKIISTDNITLAYSQEMNKLQILNNVFSKNEFSLLMDKIGVIVDVRKKKRTASYFNKYYKDVKYITIAYGITRQKAKELKVVLDRFLFENKHDLNEKYYRFALSGERRVYPYADFLTPVLGYCKKLENANLTYTRGVRGIENFYDSKLTSQNNQPKDIYLSISFDLQQELEEEVFLKKVDIDADEVISIVLNPKTFNIKAIASSNRFNPKSIHREDYSSLNINAVEVLFDINEYLTPIQNAIQKEKNLTLEEGYKKFGFYEKSGVDLNYEKVSKDTLQVNLMQLLKMYGVFYSGGKIATPTIAKQDRPKLFEQIISKENALDIKNTLVDFFKEMPSDKVYIREIEFNSQNYLQIFLTLNPKNEYYSDEVSIVKTSDDFPYLIVHSYSKSSSNQVHTYHFYSKKSKNIRIGQINQPLNKYQANNRNGSEAIVEGVYRGKDKKWYVDRLTTKGTKTASCNACQEYNVETLEITDDGVNSVNIRPFDIETYKQMN